MAKAAVRPATLPRTDDLMELVGKYENEIRQGVRYLLRIKFRDKLVGGQPKSQEIMKTWLESRHIPEETIQKQVAQMPTDEAIASDLEKSWTGFFVDEELGLYVGCYQFKAMMKECASVLGLTVSERGSKQILQHGFEVKGLVGRRPLDRGRLYLGKKNPDGSLELTGTVSGPSGTRSIVSRHDYVEGVELEVGLWSLADTRVKVHDDYIAKVLALAKEDGLGAKRPYGHGKFDIVGFRRIG